MESKVWKIERRIINILRIGWKPEISKSSNAYVIKLTSSVNVCYMKAIIMKKKVSHMIFGKSMWSQKTRRPNIKINLIKKIK